MIITPAQAAIFQLIQVKAMLKNQMFIISSTILQDKLLAGILNFCQEAYKSFFSKFLQDKLFCSRFLQDTPFLTRILHDSFLVAASASQPAIVALLFFTFQGI